MQKIKLFTYLKNADLQCLSAYDAITSIMGYKKLVRLRNYGLWDIAINASTPDEAKQQIEKVLRSSYYILNPNKQDYFMNKLPTRPIDLDTQTIVVQVFSEGLFKESSLIEKIKQKGGVSLQSIKRSMVWVLTINDSDTPLKDLYSELEKKVVRSSSQKQGLLMNPVNETAVFLDPKDVYVS